MLELDEETGLRDYDVNYALTGSRDGLTVDQAQELAMAVLVDGIGDEHT